MGLLDGLMNGLSKIAGDVSKGLGGIGSSDTMQMSRYAAVMAKAFENNEIYDGMDHGEKILKTKEVLERCGADKTPDSSLGKVYIYLQKQADNIGMPVADESCPQNCPNFREHCEACLEKRKKVYAAFRYLDDPEEYRSGFTLDKNYKPEARICSLCGAPLDEDMVKCEYCDTYAGELKKLKIVSSLSEIPSAEMAAYEAVYDYMCMWADINLADKDAIESGINLTVAGFMPALLMSGAILNLPNLKKQAENEVIMSYKLKKQKMTKSELFRMAKESEMSADIYLYALFDGNADNLATHKRKLQQQATEQQREIQKQKDKKALELKLQAIEKEKQANREYWERQRSINAGRVPKYAAGGGGGALGSKCCGNCALYMVSDNKCAGDHRYSINASDYCAWHTYK